MLIIDLSLIRVRNVKNGLHQGSLKTWEAQVDFKNSLKSVKHQAHLNSRKKESCKKLKKRMKLLNQWIIKK